MIEQFIKDIQSFMAAHNMTPTQFGIDFMSDPSFVPRLVERKNCMLTTIEKVNAAMKAHAAALENSGGQNA